MRFLMITFFRKPGGQIDEQVTVGKRVKQSDLQTCNVILDFQKKRVDKCVIEGKIVDTDWDKMSEYYKRIYPSLVDQLEKNNAIHVK